MPFADDSSAQNGLVGTESSLYYATVHWSGTAISVHTVLCIVLRIASDGSLDSKYHSKLGGWRVARH
jgi:hypothetical protein